MRVRLIPVRAWNPLPLRSYTKVSCMLFCWVCVHSSRFDPHLLPFHQDHKLMQSHVEFKVKVSHRGEFKEDKRLTNDFFVCFGSSGPQQFWVSLPFLETIWEIMPHCKKACLQCHYLKPCISYRAHWKFTESTILATNSEHIFPPTEHGINLSLGIHTQA